MATALTADFLGGGGTLAAPKVLTPKQTAAEKAKADEALKAAAQAELRAKAQKTATASLAYGQQRTVEHQRAIALNNKIALGPAGQAGIDWGLIPMGAAVLATGAAIIGTAGAAAPALGAGGAAGGGISAAALASKASSLIEEQTKKKITQAASNPAAAVASVKNAVSTPKELTAKAGDALKSAKAVVPTAPASVGKALTPEAAKTAADKLRAAANGNPAMLSAARAIEAAAKPADLKIDLKGIDATKLLNTNPLLTQPAKKGDPTVSELDKFITILANPTPIALKPPAGPTPPAPQAQKPPKPPSPATTAPPTSPAPAPATPAPPPPTPSAPMGGPPPVTTAPPSLASTVVSDAPTPTHRGWFVVASGPSQGNIVSLSLPQPASNAPKSRGWLVVTEGPEQGSILSLEAVV